MTRHVKRRPSGLRQRRAFAGSFANPRRRRGAVTLWTIMALPALLAMLCFVVEATNLWLSRAQLENALEAAALAAVKHWGEAGGGPTLEARRIGVAYASYNGINEVPVVIDPNGPNPAHPNENDSCEGDLIFGEVTADEVQDEWLFNANEEPSCGAGRVLVDATGEGNVNTGNFYSGGVAFLNDEDTDPNLRICTVTITLPPGVGNVDPYFEAATFGFSDNSPSIFDNEALACQQNDIVGLDTSPPNILPHVAYEFLSPAPCSDQTPEYFKELRFSFPLDGSLLEFAPCDRFRFGVAVRTRLNNQCDGVGNVDGDAIGDVGTTVTVVFAQSGDGSCDDDNPTATATFQNLTWRNRQCTVDSEDEFCNAFLEPRDRSHILYPPGIPNLPNGAIQNNPNKDGQSYALTRGAGDGAFGVRAQATLEVPSLCAGLCGLNLPFEIRAKATAMYDCTEGEPRLIRVLPENFTCILPPP